MADMVYTPDGKGHPLLHPGNFLSIVEEYAGKDMAAYVEIMYDELPQEAQENLPFIY